MAKPAGSFAAWVLTQEARALLTRLERLKPFALQETMVPAAALATPAQTAIERFMERGQHEMRVQVRQYLDWLAQPDGRRATPAAAQRRFTFLRLRFNAVLSHLDIFSEAMGQRSETETGVFLSGLDEASREALALPGYFDPPPVVCYLARGPGAAIRRARTRLPGGRENPIAIIRVPRERMVGAGIASSLVHEVGHQGAALLDLVRSLRMALEGLPRAAGLEATAWSLWSRWISEVVADLWSICKVGVTSTTGLIGVVSLPAAFVFRSNLEDPHPTPYVRVKLSAAIGKAIYPDAQWDRLAALWEEFYPKDRLPPDQKALLAAIERTMPRFIEVLIGHRPRSLRGQPLAAVMATEERHPARLRTLYGTWRSVPAQMKAAPPSLAFAVIGQARADGAITPEDESAHMADLLRHWALRSTLDSSAACAAQMQSTQDLKRRARLELPLRAVH